MKCIDYRHRLAAIGDRLGMEGLSAMNLMAVNHLLDPHTVLNEAFCEGDSGMR